MQLNPGERSLLAYFTNDNQAKQALLELEKQGFTQIDINSLNSNITQENSRNRHSNLSSMVYRSNEYDKTLGPLLAADPLVSGMSSSYEHNQNYSCVLTMITDNTNYQNAVNIIRQNGGSI